MPPTRTSIAWRYANSKRSLHFSAKLSKPKWIIVCWWSRLWFRPMCEVTVFRSSLTNISTTIFSRCTSTNLYWRMRPISKIWCTSSRWLSSLVQICSMCAPSPNETCISPLNKCVYFNRLRTIWLPATLALAISSTIVLMRLASSSTMASSLKVHMVSIFISPVHLPVVLECAITISVIVMSLRSRYFDQLPSKPLPPINVLLSNPPSSGLSMKNNTIKSNNFILFFTQFMAIFDYQNSQLILCFIIYSSVPIQ